MIEPASNDDVFRALGDPTRRGIFEFLCRTGGQTVTAVTAQAGVSQPAVSKHLAALKRAGLVTALPDGRKTRYTARAEGLAPLEAWTRDMTNFWLNRFDDLETLLSRMDQ